MPSRRITFPSPGGPLGAILLTPRRAHEPAPAIVWLHGGGYSMGMPSMVYLSCAARLADAFGAVVLAPAYRLAGKAPYPAALEDCYAALAWLWEHADSLGVDRGRITVGGESAGGGLTAAVCLAARDRGEIPIAMQLPLYPMLDCFDTPSSADSHAHIWNTARNHWAWKRYLGSLWGSADIPAYASPARTDRYEGLPPCYTFVCDGEPFLCETLTYVSRLRACGVPARADVFHASTHAFDGFLFWTREARDARRNCLLAYGDTVIRGREDFLRAAPRRTGREKKGPGCP